MPRKDQSLLVVEATATNGFDAAVRLLTDVERFGHALKRPAIEWPDSAAAKIKVSVAITGNCDVSNLVQRFSRHPTLTGVAHRLEAEPAGSV
jgi:hypothetical protein